MRSDAIPQVGKVQLEVPGLGIIEGLSLDNEICQYFGIPYAEIPGRFRRSIPAKSPWKDNKWDGTKLGPYCPQPPRDFYPIPSPERPWLEPPQMDEFNCLNLNISVPRLPSGQKELIPVMVFLHGGAFTYSTGSSPVYDGRLLAFNSAHDHGRPTIIVTINYRLGVYGFLAGNDLESYNKSHGESGVGNYGIWDQVLALRWVQAHISAFGGDPTRVTLFGQSAGSQSTHCHLLRDEPLFSSAIMQSGLIRLCGVLSVDEYQAIYEKILVELGIPLVLSPADRVSRLLAVDTAKLTAAMVPVYIVPVITVALCDDGILIPNGIPPRDCYTEFKVPEWCPRIMMGDATNECIIWNKSWDDMSDAPVAPGQDLATPTAPKLFSKMESIIGPQKAQQIADIYGITKQLTPKDTFTVIEHMTTDGMYSLLHYFAEKAAPGSIYAYHFDVPSAYDNAWGGLAHHSYDNVLLWGVLNHTLPPAQQRTAKLMVESFIKFAHRENPWERFGDSSRWMIFDERGAKTKTREQITIRRYDAWDKLHRLGLVPDLSILCIELCLRKLQLISGR